jgi:CBS-domain-containing membrane protein
LIAAFGVAMTIQFPDRPDAWYDVDHHTITFPVVVDGQRMTCVVTAADLMRRFAGQPLATPAEARTVYDSRKATIRELAEADIRCRRVTRPGEEFAVHLSDR